MRYFEFFYGRDIDDGDNNNYVAHKINGQNGCFLLG
jgi:hypothetical protein